MQEDLEPFSVKIESSLGTEPEPDPWRPVELFGTQERPGSEVEMKGRVWKGGFPEAMDADGDKLVGIGGEDPIVRKRARPVHLYDRSPWTPDLESHARSPWLSLGCCWGWGEEPRTEEENSDGEAWGEPLPSD